MSLLNSEIIFTTMFLEKHVFLLFFCYYFFSKFLESSTHIKAKQKLIAASKSLMCIPAFSISSFLCKFIMYSSYNKKLIKTIYQSEY